MSGHKGNRSYILGVAVAVVTSFLTVWTTIVRDDGTGIGWFLVIIAAVVGAFAAWFRPAGMARALIGVAIMQALLGVAIVTAPVTATIPGALSSAEICSGVFSALWLISAAFFRAAGKGDARAVEVH